MNVHIRIDTSVEAPEVHIVAPTLSDEVVKLQELLTSFDVSEPPRIVGRQGTRATLLALADVQRFYTEGRHVQAEAGHECWQVRERIGELAERLGDSGFVQINKGELINTQYIEWFDFSLAGTVSLRLQNGSTCFISRRCLAAVRQAVGLK